VGTFNEVPNHINPTDIVLDVGGGVAPLSRANYVIDFFPWGNDPLLKPYFQNIWPNPYYSKNTWVQWDLCSREPWPFKDKQFDFVLCRHTLEDLRDPIWVCHEMIRVGKSGYIETPSRVIESMPGIERSRYCGYSHHRWLCEITEKGIQFTFKPAQLHGYSRFHITVWPYWNRFRREHHWTESFDFFYKLLSVVNRWLREVNPKYNMIGLFWENSFEYRENVLINKRDVERDLMTYKEGCRRLKDLWTWKRTWYGKRIRSSQ
jgi:hypothetical protein